MDKKTPRITLLGNNSGRNLGDAAILSSIMEHLSNEIEGVEFLVPTIAPRWVEKHYGDKYNVKAVDVMPWTGSIRLLGIPTMHCIARSDAALICDGIIFGKKLLNPAFNYLITLIFLVPWARLMGCKVICFNCGIGPFPSKLSQLCAKWVLNGSDEISMREKDSIALAREIGVTKEMSVSGDAAFINPVSSDERGKEILASFNLDPAQPIFGVNITSYVDSWLKKEERVGDSGAFLDILADSINSARSKCNNEWQPLLFSTQPMDEKFTRKLGEKISAKVIDNSTFLSHDIMAAMRRCDLFIGMRFHSLVLASAVDVPIIGLIYAPKVRGLMRLLDCEEYGLELKQLNVEMLSEKLSSAWQTREELSKKQKPIIDSLKEGAIASGLSLKKKFFPSASKPARKVKEAANY